MSQKNLHTAKQQKMDEFYTQYADIERECERYRSQFAGKVVYLNCDDPEESNFWKYFANNFDFLKLKKLVATHYDANKKSYKLELYKDINSDGFIDGKDSIKTDLVGDGDFRNQECIDLLKEADIVVTNPPFSLFREYVAQLVEYNKKFLIIGSKNSITYKEIFKLIKENKLWLGYGFAGGNAYFKTPHYKEFANGVYDAATGLVKFRNVGWYTNMDIAKRHEDLTLFRRYNAQDYPNYDNYNAIEVSRVANIPVDYDGVMGVPIRFLDVYNPNQFEIIALGIVGSIQFTRNRKMEILKQGMSTGKYTMNAKGTLYRKYSPEKDKTPAFRDAETGELYSSIYARVIIRDKKIGELK